jgi:class 3 adenylate cyclase
LSEPKTQTGTIVVADISGYTKFLTSVELDHGTAIVRELLGTVREQLEPMLRVIRTEGDALFGYIPDPEMTEPAHLLDLVEATYHAFADHMLQVKVSSTCTCNACATSPNLDLKLVAHHADYIVEDLGGGKPDLTGPEVILAHRLLKNSFIEATGIKAYFLATDAVFDRLERPDGAIEHHESYEHFPEVTAWGFDLKESLERRRSEKRVVVRADDCDFWVERVIPSTPPIVWAWLTEPAKMNRYSGGNQFSWASGQSRKAGDEIHCAHGGSVSVSRIADWMPFEHYTLRNEHSVLFPETDMSYTLKPLAGGRTRVVIACKARRKGMLASVFRGIYGKLFAKYAGASLDKMVEVMAEDGVITQPSEDEGTADGVPVPA